MSLGGLDEQGLSSPLLLAVVINNKTSFSKDLFFFFSCSNWELTHAPYIGVRSLNHWAAREVPPRVLLIVFLVGSFKQLVFLFFLLARHTICSAWVTNVSTQNCSFSH